MVNMTNEVIKVKTNSRESNDTLITAGEFARLASTTKRTIQYYDEVGILRPAMIATNGYRYYTQRQVLEYQMILLLSTIGVSLEEMKNYRHGIRKLFMQKQIALKKQMRVMQFNMDIINEKLLNLKRNGTMINPRVKEAGTLHLYSIEKVGPYVMLETYGNELKQMLSGQHKKMVALTIFDDIGYRPKSCHMRVCVRAVRGIKVREKYKSIVKKVEFEPGLILSYTHRGPFETLSLSWKELEKWAASNGYTARTDIPDYEIYHPDTDVTMQEAEICMPVRKSC